MRYLSTKWLRDSKSIWMHSHCVHHLRTNATKHRGEQQLKCVGPDWITSQPKFAETYANMCESVISRIHLFFRCLHTQLQRNCNAASRVAARESREKRGKQIKTCFALQTRYMHLIVHVCDRNHSGGLGSGSTTWLRDSKTYLDTFALRVSPAHERHKTHG